MNIYEHHEVLGWFFLPEDPDNRVPGVLKWDPAKGAEIKLMGGISTSIIQPLGSGGVYTITDEIVTPSRTIYLDADDGKKYSIWDAYRKKVIAERECWESSQVYCGHHILFDEKVFIQATFVLDGLDYLVKTVDFHEPDFSPKLPEEEQSDGSILTHYVLPISSKTCAETTGQSKGAFYSIVTSVVHDIKGDSATGGPYLKSKWLVEYRRRGPMLTIYFGKTEVRIAFRKDNESIGDLGEPFSNFIYKPILDLVQLATFQPCGIAEVRLQTNKYESDGVLLKRFSELARPFEDHDINGVVFTLDDVPLQFFLKKWEALTKNGADYPWSIATGLCGYSPRYVEEYVIQSVAAAEGFHKLCLGKGKTYIDPDGKAQKYHLKDRLRELYNLLPEKIQKILRLNVDEWVDYAAEARNHVGHGGSAASGTVMDILDFHSIAVSVHLVTYLVILNELGVSSERIGKVLENHPCISEAKQHCSKWRSSKKHVI